jgi:hypothetical protein
MDLEGAVLKHKVAVSQAAEALKATGEFNLATPCCVIADETAVTTNLGGIRGYLPCSVALASEPIEKFLLLKAEHGFDRAFELCASDDADGEEFVQQWDACQRDLDGEVVCTINDLTAMVEQAKRGWLGVPKRLLVVAKQGSEVASGLVLT